jgi:hypothetical protein
MTAAYDALVEEAGCCLARKIGLGSIRQIEHNTLATLIEAARALNDLQLAEANYRQMHDLHGDDSRVTGRAWDTMRRAGKRARTITGGDE